MEHGKACLHVSFRAICRYAFLASLAYRQTLAATKLVWNDNENVMWLMLKEISTNGDFQTMVRGGIAFKPAFTWCAHVPVC